MRRFDIKAAKNLDQYWSSMSTTGFVIDGQVAGSTISDITFSSNHVENNRPVTKHSDYSIRLDSDPGVVTTGVMQDFKVTMLVQANTSSLWIVKIVLGTDEIGVRINTDTSMDLIWPQDEVTVDVDGNYETVRSIITESLIYSEDVSYLSLTRRAGLVSLTLNNQIISIDGPDDEVEDFEIGGGTGTALVDKIGFSLIGQGLEVADYASLFKTQRLDTVPRPNGASTFNYLLDAYEPDEIFLDRDSFSVIDGVYYCLVNNRLETGNWDINKRADFTIEYSVDSGETFQTLGTRTKIIDDLSSMMFSHTQESDSDYWLDIIMTHDVNLPMSYFNAVIDGDVFLPGEVGFGYFDADPGDISLASITLTNTEAGAVRTIEMLASINNPTETIFSFDSTPVSSAVTTGYTLYINGEPREFTTIFPNQIYHFVIVLDADADEVVINPDKTLQIDLVGLGASELAYADSDAFYIFNTFVGNPIVSALELTDELTDGELEPSVPARVLDLQWDK